VQDVGEAKTAWTANPEARGMDSFPIVGVGASAGGLEAMMELVRALPAQTGMALVLVQHLDPTHESALTSILARSTPMPVSEVKPNTRLEPNHLYIIRRTSSSRSPGVA